VKKIFLDCGTHLCEGIEQFYKKGLIDNDCEIHTFEPNPACFIQERVEHINLNIIPHNKAVWIEDGFLDFNQENHEKSRTGSPSDGRSKLDGWGSSVANIGFDHPGYEKPIRVPCLNFSSFVSKLPSESHIICKMDIEGSEYFVLRHMIEEKTIVKIKDLYVEFHQRFMKNESDETTEQIIEQIKGFGVNVYRWF
jgi:FkbM family methyltransferase